MYVLKMQKKKSTINFIIEFWQTFCNFIRKKNWSLIALFKHYKISKWFVWSFWSFLKVQYNIIYFVIIIDGERAKYNNK